MNIFNKKTEEPVKQPEIKDNIIETSAEVIHSEKEIVQPADKDIEVEENFDDPEEIDKQIKGKETQKPLSFEDEKAIYLLELSHSVRKLADAEEQLKMKKIYWKSEINLTGIMTLNEIISIAENLKVQIKAQGDILIEKYEVADEILNNKIKEFAGNLKTYDFWLK